MLVVPPLIDQGTEIVQAGMAALAVIEDLNVLEEGLGSGGG